MIRNYLGFPRGLGGSELMTKAIEQARLFGTEMVLAERVGRISTDGSDRVLETEHGRLIAKAVIIATGVDWRGCRLQVWSAFWVPACSTVLPFPRRRQ